MSEDKKIVDLNELTGEVDDTLRKIKNCKNMDELNAIRLEVTEIATSGTKENFNKIQSAFIKRRKKLY